MCDSYILKPAIDLSGAEVGVNRYDDRRLQVMGAPALLSKDCKADPPATTCWLERCKRSHPKNGVYSEGT